MRRSFCVLTFSMPNFIFGCSSTVNCAMLMLQIYRIYSNYPNKKVSNFEKNRIFLQYIHNSFSFTILSLKGTKPFSSQYLRSLHRSSISSQSSNLPLRQKPRQKSSIIGFSGKKTRWKSSKTQIWGGPRQCTMISTCLGESTCCLSRYPFRVSSS